MRARQRGAAVLVGIFGLAFALLALGFGYNFFGENLLRSWSVRSWVEAPATLVELRGYPRGLGVRYLYEYGGKKYEGTRVGFYDHIYGGEYTDIHRTNFHALRAKLEPAGRWHPVPGGTALRAKGDSVPVTIRLDPKNPADAVIDAQVRINRGAVTATGILAGMGLLFAGVGFFGFRGASPEAGARAMRERHPIRGSSRGFPVLGWLFALVWLAIVAAMGVDFRPVRGSEFLARAALAAFALTGLWLLWRAALATLRWRRYRGVVLALDPHPGEAGGAVAGSLVVPLRYDAATRFKVVLECTEHGQHGGELRKNNSFARTLYRNEQRTVARLAQGGTRLSFRFDVPAEAPASEGYLEPLQWTGATADRIFVRWTLEVSAEVEGVDLHESFEIPVRQLSAGEAAASAAMRPPTVTSTLIQGAAAAVATSRPAPPRTSAAVMPTPGPPAYVYERDGSRIHVAQPAWKKPGAAGSPGQVLLGLAFCAVFAVAGIFLLRSGEWLIGGVFLLFGGGLIAGVLGYLAHALEVDVDDDEVRIVRRIGALALKRVSLPAAGIAGIEASADAAAQRGGSSLTRSVRVRMHNGATHNVAELIPGEREALALRNLLAARLKVAASGSAAVAKPTVHAPRDTRPGRRGWAAFAGLVIALAYFGHDFWPFFRTLIGGDPPPPAVQATAPQATSRPTAQRNEPPLAADEWRTRYSRAMQAKLEKRPADALRYYGEALAIVERLHGADDPRAAALHERLGDLHGSQRDFAKAEASYRRSLEILERHPDEALREAKKLVIFDRESVMRSLGATYWELRRYADSLAHYQRAHDTATAMPLPDAERNRRLAFSATGIMISACMTGAWERADHAMTEAKARFGQLSQTAQKQLEYWIRTGEPRLAARKC